MNLILVLDNADSSNNLEPEEKDQISHDEKSEQSVII